ncbi:hypothetical protein S1361_36730 [Streptomyces cyanogenus]|uniref:Uncharacterized protein n=1 Tax=Streptomyces cyanogenus TaxID=80860 RepID=A0ABX7U1N0_STRCY|nr:hypothetical protein S1361_36730 [Streptomyces cyanogenus]
MARVLHLDDDERGCLYPLAGKTTTRTRRRDRQKVLPRLRRVLYDLTAAQAIVRDRVGRGTVPAGRAVRLVAGRNLAPSKPAADGAGRTSRPAPQPVLQETVGQVQLPLGWMVTPQLSPLPLGLPTSTWLLG